MKRILPIVAVIGCSALFVGCDHMMQSKQNENLINIKDFKETINQYNLNKPENVSKTVANYNLSIIDRDNDISLIDENLETNIEKIEINDEEIDEDFLVEENENDEVTEENENNLLEKDENANEEIDNEDGDEKSKSIYENNKMMPEISTLYYLSNDIDEQCNEFCELKTKIMEAIAESEKLSEKIKNNEVNLSREQRLYINEQTNQLKALSRQLSTATNELSFNLSDLNAIMKENNQDIDALSLKYLIVLDNLINGNEMLQNGLSSLNLINNMMHLNTRNLPNNGKILYGYQQNNNPPVIKEYYVNENGDLVGKQIENETNNENVNNDNLMTLEENEKKVNIDTYKDTNLVSNIDTYGNTRQNIDTFFNTALLDNDFMFGGNNLANNGMYGNNLGYGGMYGGYPNIYQYAGYEQQNKLNNSTNGVNNNLNTPNVEQQNNNQEPKKTKKKFKLKSNIDTYKDAKTPDIKTKIKNFKSSISNFFNRAMIDDNQKVVAPIYKMDI